MESVLIQNIDSQIGLSGKRILEVGCGNGDLLKEIAMSYPNSELFGIDPGLDSWWNTSEQRGENYSVQDGDAESLSFENNYFDAVFTIATFEHIGNIEKALSEIKRVLKPYGRCYSSYAPIYTSIIGHHFCPNPTWDNEYLYMIPPWGHLYMSRSEMEDNLAKATDDAELINSMLEWIYESDIINRCTRRQQLDVITNSGLIVRNLREVIRINRCVYLDEGVKRSELPNELTPEVVERISSTKYAEEEIRVFGLSFTLEKYKN